MVPAGRAMIISRCIGLGIIAASACRGSPSKAGDSSATRASTNGRAASYGLKLVGNDEFAIAVPDEAIVERRDSLGQTYWLVHAPAQQITATFGTADTTRFTGDRPLYTLTIATRQKPAAQSLRAWGDSLVAADEETADELTKGETGRLDMVAGEPAYLREPTCGDCGVYIFTFARGTRLVEVEYSIDTVEPLGVHKHGIYALILSTFRWTP